MARRLDPYLALVIMGFAASWAAIFIRWCQAPPTAIAFWRLGFAALLSLPWALVSLRRERLPVRRLLPAVAAGVVLGLHFWAWIASLELTTLAASMLLLTTQLVLALLLSAVLLHEPPSRRVLLAAGLALAGTLAIGLRHLGAGRQGHLLGDLLALSAAALFVVYMLIGRRARPGLPVGPYLCVLYGSAAATTALAAGLVGEPLGGFDRRTWLLFVALAAVPTLLGHGMANYAVRYVRVYVVNLTILAEPVLTLVWAALLWAELPTGVELVGGAMILLGGGLAIDEERRRAWRVAASGGAP